MRRAVIAWSVVLVGAVATYALAQGGGEPVGGWTVQFVVAAALISVVIYLLKRFDSMMEAKDQTHAAERQAVAEMHGRRWEAAEKASAIEREQFLLALQAEREAAAHQTETLRSALQNEHREITQGLAGVASNVRDLVLYHATIASVMGRSDVASMSRDQIFAVAMEAVRTLHERGK